MNSRFPCLALLAASLFIYSPLSVSATSDVVDALKACARIVEQDARAACYEALGKRVLEEETSAKDSGESEQAAGSASAVTATAVAVSSTPQAPDGKAEMGEYVGGYKFEEKPSDHPDNTIYARVILCQQDRDKAWFFKFENGQVWKQVDRTRLNFQGCDFPVAILKDGFGYKMQIEGSERQIRISRRK